MADRIFICKYFDNNNEQQRFETLNNFRITQDELNGLNQLMNWLEGFKAVKSGVIPGEFELVMFYRSIVAHLYEQRNKTT